MLPLLVSLLALATALTHLWTEYYGPRWLGYGAKPATTILLLLLAVMASAPRTPAYGLLISIGLLCSLAGDIFLMLPNDHFIAGLASFLLAHLCYIIAFGAQLTWPYWSWWGAPVVLFAIIIYAVLAPTLGKLRLPVLLYMAVISLMALLAITLFMQQRTPWTFLAAGGAILFVISDAALALNRFRRPFRSAQVIVLGTYYLAQWLIALSIYPRFA